VTDREALIIGATHSFEETPHPFLVLVPGSEANTTSAMGDGQLIAWLKKAHETSTMTTSVCSGALVLAAAGLLDEQRATTHWWALPSLSRFGAITVPDRRVVRSGKIWTAAGVSAGLDLGLELFREIAGQESAEIAQLIIEYDPILRSIRVTRVRRLRPSATRPLRNWRALRGTLATLSPSPRFCGVGQSTVAARP
jgi:transcriptional regulator GlxA family with amidase domain